MYLLNINILWNYKLKIQTFNKVMFSLMFSNVWFTDNFSAFTGFDFIISLDLNMSFIAFKLIRLLFEAITLSFCKLTCLYISLYYIIFAYNNNFILLNWI